MHCHLKGIFQLSVKFVSPDWQATCCFARLTSKPPWGCMCVCGGQMMALPVPSSPQPVPPGDPAHRGDPGKAGAGRGAAASSHREAGPKLPGGPGLRHRLRLRDLRQRRHGSEPGGAGGTWGASLTTPQPSSPFWGLEGAGAATGSTCRPASEEFLQNYNGIWVSFMTSFSIL